MFIHNMKYTIRSLVKSRVSLFWAFIFPLALATFMYLAFGNILSVDEAFSPIEVAVVSGETGTTEETSGITYLLDALSEGDEPILHVTAYSEDEAKQALNDGKADGIVYTSDIRLVVKKSSINAGILESILTQYRQNEAVIADIAKTHPEKLQELVDSAMSRPSFYVEKASTDGNQNPYTNYFYAIFAMSCLFASFSSLDSTSRLQANTSPLGIRKCVSSGHKLTLILSDFSALLLVHFATEVIALGYMRLLGIDFGEKYGAILLTLLLGCVFGLAMGVIIGAPSKFGYPMKVGIAISVSMILSVLSDLVAAGVKDMIEHHAPLINRINPAALISNCFYSLNVYDGYGRYFENLIILAIESVVLIFIGYLMIRRNKYASI